MKIHGSQITAHDLTRDGRVLLGTEHGLIFEYLSGGGFRLIAIGQSGDEISTLDGDSGVVAWQTLARRVEWVTQSNPGAVRSFEWHWKVMEGIWDLAVADGGNRLVAAGGSTLGVLDVKSGKSLLQVTSDEHYYRKVDATRTGTAILVDDFEHIDVWDIQAGKQLHRLPCPGAEQQVGPNPICLSNLKPDPTGRFIAFPSGSASLIVHEVSTGKLVDENLVLEGGGEVSATAMTPDANIVCAGGHTGGIAIWDRGTNSVLRETLPGNHIDRIDIADAGDLVLIRGGTIDPPKDQLLLLSLARTS